MRWTLAHGREGAYGEGDLAVDSVQEDVKLVHREERRLDLRAERQHKRNACEAALAPAEALQVRHFFCRRFVPYARTRSAIRPNHFATTKAAFEAA